MTYEAAVDYVLQIPKFTKKNIPADTAAFYAYMGKPGSRSSIIHIAGTNGKGSVCAYLNSCLLKAGHKVGMFTSPHLVDIRERFRIQSEMAEKEDFLQAFCRVMEMVNNFQKEKENSYHPTFFEMMFFIGMVIFERAGVDYLILETGLGGRLDATNVVESPILAIITKVAFDHMEYLGNTLGKIAGEKAGIIKQGVPVVFWGEDEEVSSVLVKRAQELGSPSVLVSNADVDLFYFHKKCVDFSIKSEYYGYIRCRLNTSAGYQRQNAALAVRALEQIGEKAGLSREMIEQGMSEAVWEGRMEEVLPEVYLDGAHNEDGMSAFLESAAKIKEISGQHGKTTLLFCAVSDKQVDRLAEMIAESGLFDRVALAPVQNMRSLGGEALEALFASCTEMDKKLFPNVGTALHTLLDEKSNEELLFIAGSLYLAGEVKAWIRDRKKGKGCSYD